MSKDFSFHPAPARSQRHYRLDGQQLTQEDGWQLDLGQVTRAAYVQHRMGDSLMRRLDLWQGETRYTIGWNGAAGGWTRDEGAHAFLELCSQVGEALQDACPTLRLTWGEYGRYRKALFVIGLLSLLGGIGIFAAALASGVSGSRLMGAAVPMGLLVLLGGAIGLGNAPWRPLPSLDPKELAPILRAMSTKGRETEHAA